MKIFDNLQTLVTIGYLTMVFLGIVFTGAKYSHFGINIFSYSDALDFLIAPFKDIQIIVYTIIAMLIIYLFYQFDKIVKAQFPKIYSLVYFGLDKRKWFKRAWAIQWVVALIVYTMIASLYYGNKAKSEFDLVAKNVVVEFQNTDSINGKLIGSNSNFLFIQNSANKTLIIPINSAVRTIQIPNKNNN